MSIGQRVRNKLILFGICDEMKSLIWNERLDEILAVSDIEINSPPPFTIKS